LVDCEKCGKEFNSEDSLKQHIESKHSSQEKEVKTSSKPGGNKKLMMIGGAIVLIVIIGIVFVLMAPIASGQPGEYDSFAKCIGDSGATFYGAFWCPHCESQREMFGTSQDFLPYVECSTPDGKNQTQICVSEGISSYPTWDLPNGSRITGVQSFDTLSQVTNCPLVRDTV